MFESQALEAKEKQRVSLRFRLTPISWTNSDSFYVRASLRNFSVRELSLLMIGIRVWKGNKWNDAISVDQHQEDLIVSDNLINVMPLGWKSALNEQLRLRELDDITLEPTEQEYEQTFGPYKFDPEQKGMWITGRAYVAETEKGTCAIDTSRQPKPGVLPYVCERGSNGTLDCNQTRCSVAIAPGIYYSDDQLKDPMRSREK